MIIYQPVKTFTMTRKITGTSKKLIVFLALPLVLTIAILALYHLFYKSKRVDNGIVQPGIIFNHHTGQLRGVRFDPAGRFVVTGSVDSTVRIWQKRNRRSNPRAQPSGRSQFN